MTESLLEQVAFWVMNVISTLGYPGIFALMALESALIPIPSEIIMPFSGFLVSEGRFSLPGIALAGALGNLVGSWAAYGLGWWAHDKVVRKLVKKYGKFILLSEEEYNSALKLFSKNGQLFVAISRLLPAIRTVISLPAGVARLSFPKFSVLTFFGCLIWSYFLGYLGVILGENWQVIRPYFRKFDILIVAVTIILVGAYIYHKLQKLRVSEEET
ncbi:DedA family protein [Candidatus Curtissbacteria bacterium]|nr:DedA family protein [Candidatus Curtissbacteria bacterium]MBI2594381.1 DedA family protein [Candidatus Curtissbacteria bacterium]